MKAFLAVRHSAMMLFLSACLVFSISGQSQSAGLNKTAQEKVAKQDASQGISLNGTTDIQDNVEVQAILLTRGPASHIFGKEIANNYAIVQVTISNQSSTSALILQSVSLDYSKWLMSGLPMNMDDECAKLKTGLDKAFQRTCPARVGSVEARVIRGELQDAATGSTRNWVVRGAVLVGTMASGYSFLGPRGFSQGVTGYNGSFVPGLQTFWPDQSLPQINRVSDFGFQTNKVIPKDSADIVYAFFPIDRFLTPGLRKVFLNSPALFFAPFELFADQKIGGSKSDCNFTKMKCLKQSEIDGFKKELLETVGIDTKDTTAAAYYMPMRILLSQCLTALNCEAIFPSEAANVANFKTYNEQARALWNLLSGISLSNVNVLVGGVMTVDVTTVPAALKRVTFEGSDSDVFSNTCEPPRSGSLSGQFLSNGVPSISQIDLPSDPLYKDKVAADFVSSITAVPEQTNDLGIAFQLSLKNPIPPKSVLHFNVTKYDQGDTKKVNPIKSADLLYTVDYVPKSTVTSLTTKSCADQKKDAAKPSITAPITFPSIAAGDWDKTGVDLKGLVSGNNLTGGTIKVSKVTLADATAPDPKTYGIDGEMKLTPGAKEGDFNFEMKATTVVPKGAKLAFVVTTTAGTSGEMSFVRP